MAITLTVNQIDAPAGSQFVEAYGTFAFSGSYTAGGEAVTWAGAGTAGAQIPSSQAPIQVWIQSQGASGFNYAWNAGTAKVQVFQYNYPAAAAGAATELPAGAYPAGITGDTVVFEAIFKKLQ